MTHVQTARTIQNEVVADVIDVRVCRTIRFDIDIGERPVVTRCGGTAIEFNDAVTSGGTCEIFQMDVGPA